MPATGQLWMHRDPNLGYVSVVLGVSSRTVRYQRVRGNKAVFVLSHREFKRAYKSIEWRGHK